MRAPWSVAAVMVSLLLAGCTTSEPHPEGDPAAPDVAPFDPATYAFAGEFLAAGVDEAIAYDFEVPNGTTEVEAILTWTIPGASLDFSLRDPTGAENGNGWGESDQHRYVTSTYEVVPGTWQIVVSIQQGVDVHFDVAIEARQGVPFGPIAGTYTVMPNDFAEVNLNMVPGDHFNFTWTSDSEVYFNVHFHNNGTTDRPIEYRGTSMDGNFTGPANEVYSMLWRNEGALPVEVTFAMDGVYRLHSMTRDAP